MGDKTFNIFKRELLSKLVIYYVEKDVVIFSFSQMNKLRESIK